jgi:hypothetical protein
MKVLLNGQSVNTAIFKATYDDDKFFMLLHVYVLLLIIK